MNTSLSKIWNKVLIMLLVGYILLNIKLPSNCLQKFNSKYSFKMKFRIFSHIFIFNEWYNFLWWTNVFFYFCSFHFNEQFGALNSLTVLKHIQNYLKAYALPITFDNLLLWHLNYLKRVSFFIKTIHFLLLRKILRSLLFIVVK